MIKTDCDGDLAIITLDRPDKANALTADMLRDLIVAVRAARSAKAMILTGTGYVTDTAPLPYADLPPENTSDGTLWPVVGIVTQPEQDRIRILMPQPLLESDLDILDLRRKPAPEPPEEAAPTDEADVVPIPDDAPVE